MLINGEPSTHVSASDRGLQYGDGLFETIAIVDSRPCLWERHYKRLVAGGARLGIAIPSASTLLKEIQQEIGTTDQGVIKLIITRGAGTRGYAPATSSTVTRIVQLSQWPDNPNSLISQGVVVRVCATRLGANPVLAGIKHLNRLEQVLARGEWSDPEIKEGLMLDARGRVIEGTMSNIFMFKDGVMFTPAIKECGIEGVMRELVLDVAKEQGAEIKVGDISLSEVLHADSLMLTNSIVGVWPIKQLDDREYNLKHLNHELISEVMSRAYVE